MSNTLNDLNSLTLKPFVRRVIRPACAVAILGILSACSATQSTPTSMGLVAPTTKHQAVNDKTKFSSAAYGVAASPRITTSNVVKKGGGRSVLGKPYKIRGKWYTPKEDFNYDKTGLASWYGPNFHGRLTANGEIYDQTHLSAAHPTFPLPSYARVTNQANGRSVIVRVNDRGPYAHGRIIDLSSEAANVLNTKKEGVAKVRVQYIGRAPLHGQDMAYLTSSYKGDGAPSIISRGTQFASNVVKAPLRVLKPKAQPRDLLTAIAGKNVYVPSADITGTIPKAEAVSTAVKVSRTTDIAVKAEPVLKTTETADTLIAAQQPSPMDLGEKPKKKRLTSALLKSYLLRKSKP